MTDELGILNSYDTWHGKFVSHLHTMYMSVCGVYCLYMYMSGTKNVAKELKKIAQGANKWEGVNWFRQLSDKRKKTYLYMYMYMHLYIYICVHVYLHIQQ